MNINSVTITGNLTRDPELRYTSSGTAVCDLGVAVNDREKVNGEWTDRASFLTVTLWGKLAENANEYLMKGRPVAISGRLRQERWETESGDKRERVKIVAQTVQYLNAANSESSPNDAGPRDESHPEGAEPATVGTDDDIPF